MDRRTGAGEAMKAMVFGRRLKRDRHHLRALLSFWETLMVYEQRVQTKMT